MWIGNKLSPLGSLPVWLIILLSSLLVTSLTEVASNAATITLLLPILSPLVSISLIPFVFFLKRAVFCFACSHIVIQNHFWPEWSSWKSLIEGSLFAFLLFRRAQLSRTLSSIFKQQDVIHLPSVHPDFQFGDKWDSHPRSFPAVRLLGSVFPDNFSIQTFNSDTSPSRLVLNF